MGVEDLKNWHPKPLPALDYDMKRDGNCYESFKRVMERHYVTRCVRGYKKIADLGYGHPEEHEYVWITKPYATLGVRYLPKPISCFFGLDQNDERRYWLETAVTLGNDALNWFLCGYAEPEGAPGRDFYDSVQTMVIKGYYPRDHKIPTSWFFHSADHVLRRVAHLAGADVVIKEKNGIFTIGPDESR